MESGGQRLHIAEPSVLYEPKSQTVQESTPTKPRVAPILQEENSHTQTIAQAFRPPSPVVVVDSAYACMQNFKKTNTLQYNNDEEY